MATPLALITGASGFLGKAVVNKFLSAGYFVAGTVIPDDPIPLDISGNNFEKIIVNLGNAPEAETVINDIIAKHRKIDVVVLTVGGFTMGKIEDTTIESIRKQFWLNFETTYNVARPVFLQMQKQGSGRIFMIGSKPGLDSRNSHGMVAYGLSKSLVFRLAELLNDEAKGTDVVSSVIVPSTIDTHVNRQAMPKSDPSNWVKPEAIADVIHFYCSAEASILREPVIKVYNKA